MVDAARELQVRGRDRDSNRSTRRRTGELVLLHLQREAETEFTPLKIHRGREEHERVGRVGEIGLRATVEEVHPRQRGRKGDPETEPIVELRIREKGPYRRRGGVLQIAVYVFGEGDVGATEAGDSGAGKDRPVEEIERNSCWFGSWLRWLRVHPQPRPREPRSRARTARAMP